MDTNEQVPSKLNFYRDDALVESINLPLEGKLVISPSDWLPEAEQNDSKIVISSSGDKLLIESNTNPTQIIKNNITTLLPSDLTLSDIAVIAGNISVQIQVEESNQSSTASASEMTIETQLNEVVSDDVDEHALKTVKTDPVARETVKTSPVTNETSLTVTQTQSLSRGGELNRLGCAYCFRTLDPVDKDESLRGIVKVDGLLYHEDCLKKCNPAALEYATPVAIKEPEPLEPVQRFGMALYGGPVTFIHDVPLGVTKGTIAFTDEPNGVEQQSVVLQNNSEKPIIIDRSKSPVWAFIDYGDYNPLTSEFVLNAGQSRQIDVYPHPVRPIWQQELIQLIPTQSIMVANTAFVFQYLISIGLLIVFVLVNLNSAISVFTWRAELVLGSLPAMVITNALIIGWVAYMMPASLLWFIHNKLKFVTNLSALKRIEFVHKLLSTLMKSIYSVFAERQIIQLYEDKRALVVFGVLSFIIGLVLSLIFVGLYTGLVSLADQVLGNFGNYAVRIAYLALGYYVTMRLLRGYGIFLNKLAINIRNFVFRLGREIYQSIASR